MLYKRETSFCFKNHRFFHRNNVEFLFVSVGILQALIFCSQSTVYDNFQSFYKTCFIMFNAHRNKNKTKYTARYKRKYHLCAVEAAADCCHYLVFFFLRNYCIDKIDG